jgi:hypothetical protein
MKESAGRTVAVRPSRDLTESQNTKRDWSPDALRYVKEVLRFGC